MPVLHQFNQLFERQQGQVGVLPPPPGVTVDFDNPQSNALGTVVVAYLFLVLTILFVGARFYTKIAISRSVGWDDCKKMLVLPNPRPTYS